MWQRGKWYTIIGRSFGESINDNLIPACKDLYQVSEEGKCTLDAGLKIFFLYNLIVGKIVIDLPAVSTRVPKKLHQGT